MPLARIFALKSHRWPLGQYLAKDSGEFLNP